MEKRFHVQVKEIDACRTEGQRPRAEVAEQYERHADDTVQGKHVIPIEELVDDTEAYQQEASPYEFPRGGPGLAEDEVKAEAEKHAEGRVALVVQEKYDEIGDD